MLAEVRSAEGHSASSITIGLTPSLMRLVGVDTLIEKSGPDEPRLRLVEALSIDLAPAIEQGKIDIAFAYEVDERIGLIREPVIRDELLFVTAPGTPTGPIGLREALSHNLFFAGDHGIVTQIQREAARLSLKANIISNIQSVQAIRSRLEKGGASLLPFGTVCDLVKSGSLVVRRIKNQELTRILYIIRRADSEADRNNPAVTRMLGRISHNILQAAAPYAMLINPKSFQDVTA